MRFGWTIRELMLLILAIGGLPGPAPLPLGPDLRADGRRGRRLRPGPVVRLPRDAQARRRAARDNHLATRTRSLLVAQSYVLVWAAWYFAGILVALAGVLAWWILRPPRG